MTIKSPISSIERYKHLFRAPRLTPVGENLCRTYKHCPSFTHRFACCSDQAESSSLSFSKRGKEAFQLFDSKMTMRFGLKHYSMELRRTPLSEFCARQFRQMRWCVGSVVDLVGQMQRMAHALVVDWVGCLRTGTLIQRRSSSHVRNRR